MGDGTAMPATTPCPHCGTIGLVRKEDIFRKGDSYTQFYCAHCNRAWTEASGERRKAPRATTDKPDRSRS